MCARAVAVAVNEVVADIVTFGRTDGVKAAPISPS
jgi:hypothetical protein